MSEQYIKTDDGVRLFCRVKGSGRPLLLIHGAMVDADFYNEVQELLSGNYMVITYDRRGYSRSAQGEDYCLERQAKDAEFILNALTDEKAIVVGCSAGALTALKLKELFPEKVDRLFVHEPPIVTYDGIVTDEIRTWLDEIRDQVNRKKISRAVLTFIMGMASNAEDPRVRPLPPEVMQRQLDNGKIFVEKEFPEEFDETNQMINYASLEDKQRITVLIGDSSNGSYCARASTALADDLGTSLYYVPGGHNGARDLPFEFAAMLLGLLEINK
ncbi:MAG: alpha/beta hydrolase [Erysipelotrichaceae bacterium]|nr:alpha/beta hydrolase [Erysipelotrichaceae bacterium]